MIFQLWKDGGHWKRRAAGTGCWCHPSSVVETANAWNFLNWMLELSNRWISWSRLNANPASPVSPWIKITWSEHLLQLSRRVGGRFKIILFLEVWRCTSQWCFRASLSKRYNWKLEEPFHLLARKLARIIPLFNCLTYCMPLCWVSFFAWSINPGLLYSCWPYLCQWIVLLLFVVILHCCFRNLCVEIQIPTYSPLRSLECVASEISRAFVRI